MLKKMPAENTQVCEKAAHVVTMLGKLAPPSVIENDGLLSMFLHCTPLFMLAFRE
jgi:hypothetical protein